jgi:transketolase
VGGGFAYGQLGSTHYGIEDINVMRGLPNMKIVSPADKYEIEASLDYIFNNSGPKYIRLNRG